MVGYDANLSPSMTRYDYALSGIVSGFTSRAIAQPLDVLKIRFQLQVEPLSRHSFITSGARYYGIVQGFRRIVGEEGSRALWKGHFPAQIQAMVFSFIQFQSFELYTTTLELLVPSCNRSWSHFLCGAAAGSTSAIFTQPLDVIRIRFIAQGEPRLYTGMAHAAGMMLKKEGLHSFLRGLAPSLLLTGPQAGLQFVFYKLSNDGISFSRRFFDRRFGLAPVPSFMVVSEGRKSSAVVGPIQSVISGGVAGTISKIIMYPLDIVKKRMQVQGFEEARSCFGRLHVSNGFFNCFSVIYREEGWSSFYKGLQPSLAKAALSVAVRFATYEQLCNVIRTFRTAQLSSNCSLSSNNNAVIHNNAASVRL